MGEWTDKTKGKVKETVGVATGDRSLEAEGKADTIKGKIKGAVEDVKRAAEDAVDNLKNKKDELDARRDAERRDPDPYQR